jgi:Ca-activated chloride channel homolog
MASAGAHRRSRGIRAWVLVAALVGHAGGAGLAADDKPLKVRITSPMGRTGVPGTVRIVAQVANAGESAPLSVRFFVNRTLLGEDAEGPVYAVEWSDDNPFETTEIAVEAIDATGHTARDAVQLAPFELTETAQVLSVLLEVSVHDKQGRSVAGLGAPAFTLKEDGVTQTLQMVRPETLPATYTLLVDGSQSMARNVDFLRDAAGRLAGRLRPVDRVLVAPFSRTLGPITGPTADRATVADALASIEPRGGTAILDSLLAASRLESDVGRRHVIILVTDGYDEHSSTALEDAVAGLQASRSTVYVIGVGGIAGISIEGERLLKAVAAATGGRAFFPYRDEQLAQVHDRVVSDVSNRYLLSYTPSNQAIDGAFRAISLTTAEPAFRVGVKPGYFAPKPPPVRPTLEFTVTDTARRHLAVARDDLTVVEDGVEQKIDTFLEVTAPVSIVLALDESGSMRKAADAVKAAAKTFVGSLRKEDQLGILRFSDRPVLARDLSTVRSDSVVAIDEYEPRGGTALYDAVHEALSRLKRVEGRRVVVVLTDGRDENNAGNGPGSVTAFDELRESIRATEVTIFTIALGSNVDRAHLERIARDSGGDSYFPETVESLPGEYARIIEDLRRRYVISYTSTNSARDGRWRSVEIRPRIENTRVTSRGGYSPPGN